MIRKIVDSKILLDNIIHSINDVKGNEVCTVDLRNLENIFAAIL